jgi:hypothetical protein
MRSLSASRERFKHHCLTTGGFGKRTSQERAGGGEITLRAVTLSRYIGQTAGTDLHWRGGATVSFPETVAILRPT